MSKGTRRLMGALFAAVLALVLVMCILCATFARYTTSSTGDTGALTVELWDVRTEPNGGENISVETASLRPDAKNTYVGSYEGREKQSDPVKIMTFKNEGSLDAEVTLDYERTSNMVYVDAAEVGFVWEDTFTWGTGWDEAKGGKDDGTNAYMSSLMDEVGKSIAYLKSYEPDVAGFTDFVNCANSGDGMFQLDFFLEVESTEEGAEAALDENGNQISNDDENELYLKDLKADHSNRGKSESFVLKPKKSMNVYAEITWCSYYNGEEGHTVEGYLLGEDLSDAIDTIIGMYAKAIVFQIEWEAVQASEAS